MFIAWLENRARQLATKWAIPGWVLFIAAILWDFWIVTGHASTASWAMGLFHPQEWWRELRAMSPHSFPLLMFLGGLIWLTIIILWPKRNAGITIRVGKVVAHAEVWNPFQMTDRDPRITIEFDPSPAPFGEDTGFRDRKLWLCNDGGTDAFKVQMTRIDLTCGSATFGEIPQIRPRDRAIVKVEILGPAGQKNAPYAVHDLELLMTEEIKNRTGTLDWTPLEAECHINYKDHARRRFITHATLLHDMKQGLTAAKNYRFFELKLANDRRFPFLKWPKFRRLS